MILTIKSEYDTIFLVSKKPVDINAIKEIEENLKKDLIEWENNKKEYLLKHNIDESDLKFRLENLSIIEDKESVFFKKRFIELSAKQAIVDNYTHQRPKPDNVVLDKYLALGFKILDISSSDIIVNINLNTKDLDKKINTIIN